MNGYSQGPRSLEKQLGAPPRLHWWPPWWHPVRWFRPYYVGVSLFKFLGLYRRGWENAHRIVHRSLTWRIPDLPRGLAGFRILYLSDLHLDGPTETQPVLIPWPALGPEQKVAATA